jgi:tetrahydromethanopterin S-methyltransferase subunit E
MKALLFIQFVLSILLAIAVFGMMIGAFVYSSFTVRSCSGRHLRLSSSGSASFYTAVTEGTESAGQQLNNN